MPEQRRGPAQRAVQIDLPRSVIDVLFSTQHVRDSHIRIIDDHREVVRRHPVAAGDHQVVQLAIRDADRPLDQIIPLDVPVVGIAKSKHRLHACGRCLAARVLGPPTAVVAGFLVACDLRFAQRLKLIFARVAAIGAAVGQHLFEHFPDIESGARSAVPAPRRNRARASACSAE